MKLKDMFVLDTFVNGGDLVDVDYFFAGRDKMQHLVLAMILYLLLPFSFIINMSVIFILGLTVEIVEYMQYRKYGYSKIMCDKMSWRDMVANMVGALLGAFLRMIN